ncbi:hypothetical protein M9458_025056, partial [Cirrhinus mrigala]
WRQLVTHTWWCLVFLGAMGTGMQRISAAWHWTSWPSWAHSSYSICLGYPCGSASVCIQ